jgi:hypothetical protein
MPREEMLQRISSRELTGWMAYYRFKPFGEERADLRSGIAASAIVNTLRNGLYKNPEMTSVDDFMPFAEKAETVELTPDEVSDKALAIFSAIAGQI